MATQLPITVRAAPLPATFTGTLQQWESSFLGRLKLDTQDALALFSNAAAAPTSDVGPWMNGQTWYVWDSGTGAYVPSTTNGAYLVNNTVTISKLANFANTGSLIYSNASKAPTELSASATDGQVLTTTTAGGKKTLVWADTFVPGQQNFEVTLSVAQVLDILAGIPQTVAFDTVRTDPLGAFDTTNYRMPVATPEIWFVYAQVHIIPNTGAVTAISAQLDIRRDAVATGVGAFSEPAAITTATDLYCSGVIAVGATNFLDVAITITGMEGAPGDDVAIDASAINTRFGGFRIH